jgi:4-hydroxythreonine-4-phosphate dehydrogenase
VAALGLTIGDPAGIGPEIVVATLAELAPAARAGLIVYGDAGVLDRAADRRGLDVDEALRGVTLVEVTALGAHEAVPGHPDLHGGKAQVAYLEAALAAARGGELSGLVTAPINKTWAQKGGLRHPGHTELLAERLGASHPVMCFVGPRLRVALATVHEPLARVPQVLTAELVAGAVVEGARLLVRLGLERPRVGVLGLNPHAGEDGLFGDEEARLVRPGMALARARLGPDVTITGPLVPDAAYRHALLDGPDLRYDLLVALYHDQALIPVKLVDFELAVNVTLGLPGFVRTSPDHGTAYDLAGAGPDPSRKTRPRHESFAAALRLARQLEG